MSGFGSWSIEEGPKGDLWLFVPGTTPVAQEAALEQAAAQGLVPTGHSQIGKHEELGQGIRYELTKAG
jgi:hypothetical protein